MTQSLWLFGSHLTIVADHTRSLLATNRFQPSNQRIDHNEKTRRENRARHRWQ